MSEDIERRDDEGGAPVGGAAAVPEVDQAAPPSSADPKDELDRLLAEFDQQVPAQPKSSISDDGNAQHQPEDRGSDQLREYVQQTSDGEVESRARALYEQERYRSQLTDEFNKHCAKGQERIPDNLPSDYYRSELLAMSTTDPRLEVAFEAQFHDPVAIRVALDRATTELALARINPQATPEQVQGLERQVWQLGVARNARVILFQAQAAIVKKANRPQVDPDVTADRAAVTASMRDGARGTRIPDEPAPQFGLMSEPEFKRHTRENYGF
jgi:hypothetical protein